MNGGCKVGSTCTQSGWVGENLVIGTHKNQAGVKSLCTTNRELLKVSEDTKKKKHDGEDGARLDQFSKLNGLRGGVEG